jgi:hypothetical protein
MRAKMTVYDPGGHQRIIGYLDGPVFLKNIKEEVHIYKLTNSLTLDLEVFRKIATKVQAIVYRSKDREYSTTPQEFVIHGKELKAPRNAFGDPKYRDHVALPLIFWKIKDRKGLKVDQVRLFE